MEPEFWHQSWSENRIGFHQQKINSRLIRFWPDLGLSPGDAVFIPLCGKSTDMLWLAEQGYHVLGVELSETACEAFFVENDLPYRSGHRPRFLEFVSGTITLLAGEFFDLMPEDLPHVKGIYDRAALVALPPRMRERYVAHLIECLQPDCQGLLISMTYDESRMKGPPFSVGEEEIRQTVGAGFSVDILSESSGPDIVGNLRERGLDTLEEKVYRIVRLP